MEDQIIDNKEKDKRFYSQKGIAIATFIGTPFAASILIRHNYAQLGDKTKGTSSIVIGALFTILLFVGIFYVPESIVDKIPSQLIPGIYTLIVYLIVERLQGVALKQHEEEGKTFISNWKAAGIGILCGILSVVGLVAYDYFDPVAEAYDQAMEEFIQKEESAMEVYDDLSTGNSSALITEINENSIPKWEQNIKMLDSLERSMSLTEEMKVRNSHFKEYSTLRIEELELLKKAILMNTHVFDYSIDSLNREMQRVMDEMNNL